MSYNNSGPEVVDKLKHALRNQLSFWNYHMLRHKGLNMTIQRKIEITLDKAKIVLAIRIKYVERLLNDLKTCKPSKDVKEELETYWTAILPEIREVFKNVKDINNVIKWDNRLDEIQIPEVLKINYPSSIQELDAMSGITTVSTGTHTKPTKIRHTPRRIPNVKSPSPGRRPGSRG